ncbi:hypothetical protein [Croceicoccus sp. YJ47]|uniref:ATP-dependent DNA ligase n=1 Tax=Croceicoccus sp. YJ47 TaxID=2798724 RepID=UPI0035300D8D
MSTGRSRSWRSRHAKSGAEKKSGGGDEKKGGQKRTRTRRNPDAKPPAFAKPQLATLVDAVPAGNGWMHEIKFDGYRAIVAAAGDAVTIYTRSGKDWTDKFAPLAAHIAALDLPPSLLDGEIVAYGKDGNPDFSALQSVLKRGAGAQGDGDALSFHAFDLIASGGEDLTALPNIERKERLEALLRHAPPPVHVADHVIDAGEQLYRTMCDAGQEGIISKRIDAKYRSPSRSRWVRMTRSSSSSSAFEGEDATRSPLATLPMPFKRAERRRRIGRCARCKGVAQHKRPTADTLDDLSADRRNG